MTARLFGLLDRARRRGDPRTTSKPAAATVPDFEWAVYRATYVDLGHLCDESGARAHYDTYGRHEGRLGTAAAVRARIAALEAAFGPLPDGFVWADYRSNYPDLAPLRASYEVSEHYLRNGRSEGRLYRRFDPELYRSLYLPGIELPVAGLMEHYRSTGRAAGHATCAADLAAAEGIAASAWLERIDVDQFALLNEAWAGPVANKRDALRAMVREGFERLAPIGFSTSFDPGYYREANPGLAALVDAALYRQWLFEELPGGRPGSPSDHLSRHGLRLATYPEGFDWQRYRRMEGVYGDSRWALLDHVVANSALPAEAIPVREGGAAPFLAALATTITGRVAARGAALFDAAARHGPLTAADQARWGEAHALGGDFAAALQRYALALAGEAVTLPMVAAAVRVALAAKQARTALDLLARSRAAIGGDLRWRRLLGESIEAAFREAWAAAEALYAAERRAEADAVMTGIAADIERWWTSLDPIGLPVPSETPRRFVLLANVDLRQCTHYRVEQKEEIFAAAGLHLDVFTQAEVEPFLAALPGAAGALFYRLPATPMNVRAISAARAMGLPTYYDIDDLIFDPAHYPEPFDTYDSSITPSFYQSLQLGVPLFRAAMALCDDGIASTTHLAGHMETVVRRGRSFVLPNGLDSRNRAFLDVAVPKVRRDGDIVLFYGSGTRAHNSDFLDMAGDALLAVFDAHPNVRMVVAGYLTLDARFDRHRARIVQLGWIGDVQSYWSLLAEADISLAVLAPGPTTDGKSEIKWLEAAALGVASIVSATHRYAEVLTDGTDAILARTPADWMKGLRSLVADPARRAALVAAAREKARAGYGVEANAERLKALLRPATEGAAARDVPATGRKKRILLLNIFFPPQTIGGSTRVARDNLDAFLRSDLAKDCDFAVVTTDNDNPVPFQLRVEDYKGVPVFRMSTPIDPNMEWRPFNPAIGAVFDRILGLWRPDLVHVHSIQRSTASVLTACLERGIPYINTIHDAWWVCDYHFLVDGQGRLRQPEEALPLHPPPPVTVGEALERRRRLRLLLEASEEILCVSDAFTAIHRAAGYTRARSVPNGVPPLGPVVRTPSASGRVRLAQIGSQTHHKGYHLIEAALKRGRFANLELTVVDHARFGGPVERTVWGATPVQFVGKTKQEEMHTFYGDQDVLLAPSVWPESFGLVAREATAAGLWVLASDRGAIGEGVVPGVNGWVIDVSTLGPLTDTLAAIDADPARYTAPPPPAPTPARSADDQARDLEAIYRDVLARPKRERPLPYFMRPDWPAEDERPAPGPRKPRRWKRSPAR